MPDGNAAAQRVLGVGKILQELGYQVHFLGLSHDKINKKGIIEGFTYENLQYPKTLMQWFSYLLGLYGAIDVIKSYKPDLVIVYNHPAFSIDRIARYGHKHGIKIIADITEWDEPKGNPIYNLIKGYETHRRMYKSHLKLDGLICISNYLTNFYRQSNIPVLNLPPLVDINQLKWVQKYNTNNPHRLKIVYAGSPGVKKDRIDLIINAFDNIMAKRDCDVEFDVIGITSEQFKKAWNISKIYRFVNFHGRLSHIDVIRHISMADFQIFLRPDTLSNRAGFPTKFVETITSKTIPITNLSSNLSDYLIDGYNGFVIPSLENDDIENTIYKIINLTKDEINILKSRIDRNTFDYRNYIYDFEDFLERL